MKIPRLKIKVFVSNSIKLTLETFGSQSSHCDLVTLLYTFLSLHLTRLLLISCSNYPLLNNDISS